MVQPTPTPVISSNRTGEFSASGFSSMVMKKPPRHARAPARPYARREKRSASTANAIFSQRSRWLAAAKQADAGLFHHPASVLRQLSYRLSLAAPAICGVALHLE